MASTKRDMKKDPSITSIAAMIAPQSVGAHVYRVQFRAASGKFLTCDLKDGLLVARSDTPGVDCIFELHRCGSVGGAGPGCFFALRSPFGRFLNVDENIELANKEKSAKDPGLRCDRDGSGGENGANLGPSETSFEIVEAGSTGQIGLRVPQDYFISTGEGATPAEAAKTRLTKNAVAAAATLAAANRAAEIEAARAAAIAAAVAAVTPAPVAGAPTAGSAAASRGGKAEKDKADDAAAALAAAIAAATAQASAAFAASLPAAPSTPPRVDFALGPGELLTPIWLDDRSPLSLQGCFSMRTAHGRFWCADLASGSLIANRSCVSLWERWTLEPQGLTAVAFRNAHGKYLNLPSPPPANAAAATASTATATATAAAATGAIAVKQTPSPIRMTPQHTLSFVAAPSAEPAAAAATATAVAASAPALAPAAAPSASPSLPASALFSVVAVDKPRGLYSFRACNGCFLSAAGNLSMGASAREAGQWEVFELQPCDKEIG